MDEQQRAQEHQKKLQIMKAQAVSQATLEVVSENRAEIIKRARAKLTAMGIELGPEDEVADGSPV